MIRIPSDALVVSLDDDEFEGSDAINNGNSNSNNSKRRIRSDKKSHGDDHKNGLVSMPAVNNVNNNNNNGNSNQEADGNKSEKNQTKRRVCLDSSRIPDSNIDSNRTGRRKQYDELNPYPDNTVITSKFTVLNFIPLFLIDAFKKFANSYFLFVSILQMIPAISTTDGVPYSLVPLVFVLFVEALAAALEDRQRHIDDELANSSAAHVVCKGGVVKKIKWQQIRVGDILKIRNRESIPADCLILAASDDPPAAVCYVETKSLDGETNLKMRQGIVELAETVAQESKNCSVDDASVATPSVAGAAIDMNHLHPMDIAVSKLSGVIECELPNPHIDKFDGIAAIGMRDLEYYQTNHDQKVPISLRHVLLRGCVVRSTDFVYGLVINTGHDTKIVQSTAVTKTKVSDLDKSINKCLASFLFLEILICIISVILAGGWNNSPASASWYLGFSPNTVFTASDYVQRFFTFFLLVANMIPISLYVAMKFTRFFQSFFIYWDIEMRYMAADPITGDPLDVPAKVRTMDLNDALGQVSYIFSDKTGTLTNNVMEFRKFSAGGVSYGLGCTVIGVAALELDGKIEEARKAREILDIDAKNPHPRFISFRDDPKTSIGKRLAEAVESPTTKADDVDLKRVQEFFTIISLCHTVLVEHVRDDDGRDTGMVRHSASSPDDQALVVAAQEFGYRFVERANGGRNIVIEVGSPSEYIANFESYLANDANETAASAPPKSIIALPNKSLNGGESNKKLLSYELLEVLEFTSSRKRMSVIVRCPDDGRIKILSKGADSEIFRRLCPMSSESNSSDQTSNNVRDTQQIRDRTSEHLTSFASDGLRTLAVAQRVITEEEFNDWSEKYKRASTDLQEMEKRKRKEDNEIDRLMDNIESNLFLVGATAIEDKLQDGVPDTIACLADAGIKIWVLTGDKQETAINIGFACQLLDKSMKRIVINESILDHKNPDNDAIQINNVKAVLQQHLEEADQSRTVIAQESNGKYSPLVDSSESLNMALIIDGAVLKYALMKECKMLLLRLGQQCKAVICCRTSPKQKSEVVDLVKSNEKGAKTLSIGDGANDVSMIQTAHIGVGISGQEGLQAVNASDYAIAQFRYLKRLVLVHGRNNYRRMSKLVVIMFYKNVFLILAQLLLSSYNGYSGQKFYIQLGVELFNLIFSNLIVLCLAVYDKEFSDRILLQFPALYEIGLHSQLFNLRVFWSWILNGIYHALFAFFIPMSMFMMTNELDLWMFGCLTFTIVVLVANLRISLEQASWHWSNGIAWLLTLISWPICALIFESNAFVSYRWGWEWHYIFSATFSRPDAWAVLFLTIFASLLRDYTWKAAKRESFPEARHIIQEIEIYRLKAGGVPDEDLGLVELARDEQEAPNTNTPAKENRDEREEIGASNGVGQATENALPSPSDAMLRDLETSYINENGTRSRRQASASNLVLTSNERVTMDKLI